MLNEFSASAFDSRADGMSGEAETYRKKEKNKKWI